MTDVLVISGPAGVGKSAAAFEVSHALQAAGTDHVLIDTDELDRIFPVPADLAAVTRDNLAAIWRTFAARGARRLILVGVYLDRPEELAWVRQAVPDARFTCVRLTASDWTLAERVDRREVGSGGAEQLARTRSQVAAMRASRRHEVMEVTTDGRSVKDVATEILVLWPPRAPGEPLER